MQHSMTERGACTSIACTKKGKELENLKNLLAFSKYLWQALYFCPITSHNWTDLMLKWPQDIIKSRARPIISFSISLKPNKISTSSRHKDYLQYLLPDEFKLSFSSDFKSSHFAICNCCTLVLTYSSKKLGLNFRYSSTTDGSRNSGKTKANGL